MDMNIMQKYFITGHELTTLLKNNEHQIYNSSAFEQLMSYISKKDVKHVCELCGIPGSGRFALMYQVMRNLIPEKTLFVRETNEISSLKLGWYIIEYIKKGIQFVFIANRNIFKYSRDTMSFLDILTRTHNVRIVTIDQFLRTSFLFGTEHVEKTATLEDSTYVERIHVGV